MLTAVRRMITCLPHIRAAAFSLCIMTAFAACNRNQTTSAAAAEPGQQPPAAAASLPHADGQRALQFTRELVAFGPRYVGSSGHARTEAYLRKELHGDNLQEDTFTASTPAGKLRMTNFISKFPGKKDGVIVVA